MLEKLAFWHSVYFVTWPEEICCLRVDFPLNACIEKLTHHFRDGYFFIV